MTRNSWAAIGLAALTSVACGLPTLPNDSPLAIQISTDQVSYNAGATATIRMDNQTDFDHLFAVASGRSLNGESAAIGLPPADQRPAALAPICDFRRTARSPLPTRWILNCLRATIDSAST